MKTKDICLTASALLSVVLMSVSCTREVLESTGDKVDEQVPAATDISRIKANLGDFKSVTMGEETATKTTIDDNGGSLQIVWQENDTIGIFPSSGSQVAFPMASSAGSKNATFDGGGWGLKASAVYSAYYPLIGQFYLDRTSIPMVISKQVQNGNGSFEHIGKNDYMAAVNATVDQEGSIVFIFDHLVSLLHMEIKMPKGGQYSYVVIETSEKFTTEATINLATGEVTPTKQSPIQILKLENVDLSDSDDPVLELWIAIHPVDLTGHMLYTKVYDSENNCYTTTMKAMNFEAGTIYNSHKVATEDMTHTGLPVTIINTPNNKDITSKEKYIENTLMTILQTDITDEFCELMNMKGRGNSTWGAPKKPYAIKFNKKQSLMSLPADKQWVLLANYYDATLLRNDLAFFMGNEMSVLDWTPHYQQVDLMLNGQYKGIYQLGEKVKIGKGRVNVGDDGFLFEIDNRASSEDDARYFKVSHIGNPVNIKDPEVEYDDPDFNYAKEYITMVDSVLFSANFKDPDEGWQHYMDMDSFVDWYLINEISKNNDAIFYSSCYMNLKRGSKLKMGPLWDFDLAFGGYPTEPRASEISNVVENFYIKNVKWYKQLFKDPAFVARVKERFNYFYSRKQDIFDHIDTNSSILIDKIYEENKLWGRVCNRNRTEEEVKEAYQAKVDYLKQWVSDRLDWLNTNINAL